MKKLEEMLKRTAKELNTIETHKAINNLGYCLIRAHQNGKIQRMRVTLKNARDMKVYKILRDVIDSLELPILLTPNSKLHAIRRIK